jgi:hypothetical protein
LIPVGHHDGAAVARKLVRKLLAVGHAYDGFERIVSEQPGRQGDRGGQRFQMARRDVDNEAPYSLVADRLQLSRDYLDVRARQKRGAGVELGEAANHE